MKRVDRLSRSRLAAAACRLLMRCWSRRRVSAASWARWQGVSICAETSSLQGASERRDPDSNRGRHDLRRAGDIFEPSEMSPQRRGSVALATCVAGVKARKCESGSSGDELCLVSHSRETSTAMACQRQQCSIWRPSGPGICGQPVGVSITRSTAGVVVLRLRPRAASSALLSVRGRAVERSIRRPGSRRQHRGRRAYAASGEPQPGECACVGRS